MSGSEHEREIFVTDALSATAASKPAEPPRGDFQREHSWRPPAEGMYDLGMEKDSCGVGFIANIKGKKSHRIIADALNILCNLEHRGARLRTRLPACRFRGGEKRLARERPAPHRSRSRDP